MSQDLSSAQSMIGSCAWFCVRVHNTFCIKQVFAWKKEARIPFRIACTMYYVCFLVVSSKDDRHKRVGLPKTLSGKHKTVSDTTWSPGLIICRVVAVRTNRTLQSELLGVQRFVKKPVKKNTNSPNIHRVKRVCTCKLGCCHAYVYTELHFLLCFVRAQQQQEETILLSPKGAGM